MTEPEFHISSRARTISSNLPKRKMERGRRAEDGDGDDAQSVASGSVLDNHLLHQHFHQNYNPNMMKIFNDLQAFQCSGILNNNLSYASSTPMVNNMRGLSQGACMKKPTNQINPRAIDHLYNNQMRFQGDISIPNSPLPSPNTIATQMESLLQISSAPHPNIPSTQSVHLNPNVDMSATCLQRGNDSRQYFHFPDPAYNLNVGPETNPTTCPEPREGKREENNGGSYHVGNKEVVGHFQPRHIDKRLNLQRDPNFIRPILNPLGPTDLMGCQRGRQGLINLPISGRLGPKLTSSAQNISSSHRHQLREEYHELTKSNQGDLYNKSASLPKDSKLAGSHPPHISQIIPYAKLEPSPLSSSPASSIKNSPTLSHSRHLGLADRTRPPVARPPQTRNPPGKSEPHKQTSSGNDNNNQSGVSSPPDKPTTVLIRNNRGMNRYLDHTKKLSYIKEQESSMSGESLETGNHKVGSSLKHSKEADLSEEEEAVHLPDLVREIFSEFDELKRAKQQSAPNVSLSQFPSSKQYNNYKFASSEFPTSKKVSQDSGKPPSGGSSKRTSTEKRPPAPLKLDDLDYTSSYWKQVSQDIRKVKQSPQLTAVRKMQAAGRKTEGTKTRKYNAKEEDDNSTATLLYDKSTKSWKLYKNVVNAQLFLHEVNKRVEEKRRLRLEREKLEQEQKDKKFRELKENVDYITGDKEKPFIPILDPKAHALTDAECSPMLQPINHRYPISTITTSSTTSLERIRTCYPIEETTSHDGHGTDPMYNSIENPSIVKTKLSLKREKDRGTRSKSFGTSNSSDQIRVEENNVGKVNSRAPPPPVTEKTSQVEAGRRSVTTVPGGGPPSTAQLYPRLDTTTTECTQQRGAETPTTATDSAQVATHVTPAATTHVAPDLGQQGHGHLTRPSHPVMNPNHPVFQPESNEYFTYGDDRSFPRSPGCEMGCMPCLVSPHAKLLKNMGSGEDTRALLDSSPGENEAGGGVTPEVPSYLPPLDPNWELSSSEDGGSELYSEAEDENAGLIRPIRRTSSPEPESIIDSFTNKFIQFLDDTKDTESIFGNAAKFLMEKADESGFPEESTDSQMGESEEEPYIPQRKRIADDTLLGMLKKEEWKRKEDLRKSQVCAPARILNGRLVSDTELLIKTQPLRFSNKAVIFEVDYQGNEATSVPRSLNGVNGVGTSRNAPPGQFGTMAELTHAKKQMAVNKHREWERKRAARMGMSVEELRASSAGSCNRTPSPRSSSRHKPRRTTLE